MIKKNRCDNWHWLPFEAREDEDPQNYKLYLCREPIGEQRRPMNKHTQGFIRASYLKEGGRHCTDSGRASYRHPQVLIPVRPIFFSQYWLARGQSTWRDQNHQVLKQETLQMQLATKAWAKYHKRVTLRRGEDKRDVGVAASQVNNVHWG